MSKYAVYYLITDDKKIRFRIQVLTHLIIDCNTHNLREKISEYSERRFSKQISRTYYYNNKNAKIEENEL